MRKSFTLLSVVLFLFVSTDIYAQAGQDPGDNENPELLIDEFFYDFELNKPTHWNVEEGTSFILSGAGRFHSATGSAVGINTYGKNTLGKLEQRIDLKRAEKELNAGDEVEILIHYAVDSTKMKEGAIRLNMAWLSADEQELTIAGEKQLLNNSDLWFSKMKAYGTLRIRSIMPKDAISFRFCLEVNKESSVRFDDFSMRKQSNPTPFVTVIPQEFPPFETTVGVDQVKTCIVQAYNIEDNSGSITAPKDSTLTIDVNTIQPGNSISPLNIKFSPKKPIAIPSGYAAAPSVILRYNDIRINIPINAFAVSSNPDERPKVSINPASPLKIETGINQKKEIILDCKFNNMIGSASAQITSTDNTIKINNTMPYYHGSKSDGSGAAKLTVSFLSPEEGEYEGVLTFKSPMMEPLHYKITASSQKTTSEWVEEFKTNKGVENRFKDDARWQSYYSFDKGYWFLSEGVTYQNQPSTHLQLEKEGSYAYFDGVFLDGINSLKVETLGTNSKNNLSVEITTDGGGHWRKIDLTSTQDNAATQTHSFDIKTHQPTSFRIQRAESDLTLLVEKVFLSLSKPEDRKMVADLQSAIKIPETAPLKELEETFNNDRHTRNFNRAGWQNISLNGDRLFWGWDQKNQEQLIEETCAKITYYNSSVSSTEVEVLNSALITPHLNFIDVKSRILTFRLRAEIADPSDDFSVYLIPVLNNKLQEPLLIDHKTYLLPGVFNNGFWHDYVFDFKEFKNLPEMQSFFVAFTLSSPAYGKNTASSYMVDDVFWGKTEIPKITVDKTQINFYEIMDGVPAPPQAIEVSLLDGADKIVPLIIGEQSKKKFVLSQAEIPKEGGHLAVGFKADKATESAAILRLTSRRAKHLDIRLFATPKNKPTNILQTKTSQEPCLYRADGFIHIIPSETISISLYNIKGERVLETKTISAPFKIASNAEYYILEVNYSNGTRKAFKL